MDLGVKLLGIEFGCFRIILGDAGGILQSICGEEVEESPVASILHEQDVLLAPGVHGEGAHETDVDAHAAVLSGAFETEEYSVAKRSPYGIAPITVKTVKAPIKRG